MVHLLYMEQVSKHKALPEIWGDLVCTPKHAQLVVLQCALDNTYCSLEIHSPKIVTLEFFNIILSLGIQL